MDERNKDERAATQCLMQVLNDEASIPGLFTCLSEEHLAIPCNCEHAVTLSTEINRTTAPRLPRDYG